MTAQGTGGNEKEVLVPEASEELDGEIRLLKDCLGRYFSALEALKEIENERDAIISIIRRKKWILYIGEFVDWKLGQKTGILELINGERFPISEGKIIEAEWELNRIEMDNLRSELGILEIDLSGCL